MMGRDINEYFNKRFEFVGNEKWCLPTEAYKSKPWQIATLQQMKSELNLVKGQLSNFNLNEWSDHTKARDPSVLILHDLKYRCNIEVLTQAWAKMYECLCNYEVIPELPPKNYTIRSLHLCEAPGAFISALNHFLASYYARPNWEWIANSLNPYYEGNSLVEMIADDRLIKHTLKNWNFGIDQTGDLTQYYNHEDMLQHCSNRTLVTADGSIDCMENPGEQENMVHFLHYCEIMTALRVLNKSGSFILKLFTMFESGTICLMYLLNCVFKKVHVFKPCCSKSGNSEVYVICLDFKGQNVVDHLWPTILRPYRHEVKHSNFAMFPLNSINTEYISQIEKCCKFFKDEQCFTINENIKFFKSDFNNSEFKDEILNCFKKRYMVMKFVPNPQKLIKRRHANTSERNDSDNLTFVIDNAQFEKRSLTINPIIGKAVDRVVSSRFVSNSQAIHSLTMNEDELLIDIEEIMSGSYFLIKYSSFNHDMPQHLFQKEFFNVLETAVNDSKDLIIVGVPMLTRLLVDIMFIIGFGFTNVVVYRKGVILYQNPIKNKIEAVVQYFNTISNIYSRLNIDKCMYQFEPDLLQLLGEEHFCNSDFCNLICKYNDGVYKL